VGVVAGRGSRSMRWCGSWVRRCRGSSGSCVSRAVSARFPSVGGWVIWPLGSVRRFRVGCCGLSGRAIADRVGRSPSTVSRKIDRNGGRDAYRAVVADAAAYAWARRPNRASWRPPRAASGRRGSCRTVRCKPGRGVATPSCVGPSRYAFRLMAGSDGARHYGDCARVGIECRR